MEVNLNNYLSLLTEQLISEPFITLDIITKKSEILKQVIDLDCNLVGVTEENMIFYRLSLRVSKDNMTNFWNFF